MSMPQNKTISPAKIAVVNEMKEKLQSAQGAVLVGFTGLSVADVTKLRRKFREGNVEYKVIKNTLTRIAANEVGYEGLSEFLEGPTALAYSTEDAVAPAKILKEFIKETKTEALTVKVGICDGQVIDAAGVEALQTCRAAKNCSPNWLAACRPLFPVWSTYCRAISATWFMCLMLYALKKLNRKVHNIN